MRPPLFELRTALSALLSTLLLASGLAVADTPVFRMQASDADVYGARNVARGEFALGADRLQASLNVMGTARSMRGPVLNDLCVAYTMKGKFDAAQAYCDANVANGRELATALNNRGVLAMARGDLDAAVADFQAALDSNRLNRMALKNLALVEARVAARDAAGTEDRLADEAAAPTADQQAMLMRKQTIRFAGAVEREVSRRNEARLLAELTG